MGSHKAPQNRPRARARPRPRIPAGGVRECWSTATHPTPIFEHEDEHEHEDDFEAFLRIVHLSGNGR
jgi:hypothetical protein